MEGGALTPQKCESRASAESGHPGVGFAEALFGFAEALPHFTEALLHFLPEPLEALFSLSLRLEQDDQSVVELHLLFRQRPMAFQARLSFSSNWPTRVLSFSLIFPPGASIARRELPRDGVPPKTDRACRQAPINCVEAAADSQAESEAASLG
jgi:hypothetical protein